MHSPIAKGKYAAKLRQVFTLLLLGSIDWVAVGTPLQSALAYALITAFPLSSGFEPGSKRSSWALRTPAVVLSLHCVIVDLIGPSRSLIGEHVPNGVLSCWQLVSWSEQSPSPRKPAGTGEVAE